MGYEELSKQAIDKATGIPLALRVLGSHFHSKSKDTWECALRKLKKYPNEEIQSVLRFSYDVLDDVEKKVFLDIAFLFKEEDKDYVIQQLDNWDFYGASGIEALQQKALITISNDNRIQMHDLLQEMALKIVCQESSSPQRRSRLILRNKEEVDNLLKKSNKGNDVVEAMLIDVSQIGDVGLSVDTFGRMPNLRFIKFYFPWHVRFLMPPSCVIEILRGVQDLVNLKRTDLSASKQLVELPQFPKVSFLECANVNNRQSLHNLVNLKRNDIGRSKQLMELTDLSEASNVDQEYVLECESLCDAHPSFSSLQTQVPLVLPSCEEFVSIGTEIHVKSLGYLLIDGFSGWKEFSVSSREIRQLNLAETGMEILNSSIGQLSNLECLDMDGLQFKNLSNGIFCLRSTYYVRFSNSEGQGTRKPKLHILFDGLRYSRRISSYELFNLLKLRASQNISVFSWSCQLILDRSNMESLPSSMKHLSSMKLLSLRYCNKLQSLPELPSSVEILRVSYCTSLETLHESIVRMKRLKRVYVSCCRRFLQKYFLLFNLCSLLNEWTSLERVDGVPCNNEWPNLPGTSRERVVGYPSKHKWSYDGGLTPRKSLLLEELATLTPLKQLRVSNCALVIEKWYLQSLFDGLQSLRTLCLEDCYNLFELPDNISVLTGLCRLSLNRSSVVSLPASIIYLSELKILSLWGCRRLRSLPELPPSIQVFGCPQLRIVGDSSIQFNHL